MPGWGVILGVFFSQGEANAAIKKARIVLRDAFPAGKSRLVPRRWSGVGSYTALLVALEKEDASAACKRLRGKGLTGKP